MVEVREYIETLTLTGASGSVKTGSVLMGQLHSIQLSFSGVPGTTVLTFTDGYSRTLLVTPAGNTNITYNPRTVEHNAADGAALTTRAMWVVNSHVTCAATLSGAGTVTIRYQVLI